MKQKVLVIAALLHDPGHQPGRYIEPGIPLIEDENSWRASALLLVPWSRWCLRSIRVSRPNVAPPLVWGRRMVTESPSGSEVLSRQLEVPRTVRFFARHIVDFVAVVNSADREPLPDDPQASAPDLRPLCVDPKDPRRSASRSS